MWRSAVQVCLGLHIGVSQCAKAARLWTTLKFINHILGGLAQLARASALQAEGQRFESVILHVIMHYATCNVHYALKTIFDILIQAKL